MNWDIDNENISLQKIKNLNCNLDTRNDCLQLKTT